MERSHRLDTICVQAGWKPKKGEPRVLPIYQSTTFKYDTTDEMGRLFALEDEGIFTPVCRIPPMTRWQPKSVLWRAAWRPCLHPPGRRQTCMRF